MIIACKDLMSKKKKNCICSIAEIYRWWEDLHSKQENISQISPDLALAPLCGNELTVSIKTETWKTHVAYITKTVLIPDYGERFDYWKTFRGFFGELPQRKHYFYYKSKDSTIVL